MILHKDLDIKNYIENKSDEQKNYAFDFVIEKQKEKYDDEIFFFDVDEANKLFKFLSKLTLDKGKKRSKN